MELITKKGVVTDDETVTVSKAVLVRALIKARVLYVALAEARGCDPGPDTEFWSEFEALADQLGEAWDAGSRRRARSFRLAQTLDRLGLRGDIGNMAARQALREAGYRCSNADLADAVRIRKVWSLS